MIIAQRHSPCRLIFAAFGNKGIIFDRAIINRGDGVDILLVDTQ